MNLLITIPADLYALACAIVQTFDTDSGGALSFGPREQMDADGNTYTPDTYSTNLPVPGDFPTDMLTDHEQLHAFVSAAYAERWADLECPTLEDCEAFCAGAVLVSAVDIADA